MDMLQRRAAIEIKRLAPELMRPEERHPTAIGLSEKEIEKYSVSRALLQVGTSPDGLKDSLEAEASNAVAKATGREASRNGFYVPHDIQERRSRRDLTASVASAGGYLVSGVEHPRGSFIDALYKFMVVRMLGATILRGLRGNVAIPRESATSTAYWLSNETTQITDSQPTFAEIALSPKTIGVHSKYSRQLLLQAEPAVEDLLMYDQGKVLAVGVDLASLSGSGASGRPTGITNTSGIGGVTGSSLDQDKCLEFQSDVLGANALLDRAACGYIAPVAVAKLLGNRQRFTGTNSPLWEGNLANGLVAGFPAFSTEQMAASSMLFGDWSQLVIGEWGVLELSSDPFTSFKTGVIGVRAMYTIDIAVRHPESFSLATSIT